MLMILFLLANLSSEGNMIPRSVPDIPMEVKTIQEILVKLGDYSSLGEDEDLAFNIFQLSEVLVEVGKFLWISSL